jgi:hypothetical protein
MTKWTAKIKETTIRTITLEVEADDWESAEKKARDLAWAAPADDWEINDSLGFDIDVEEA